MAVPPVRICPLQGNILQKNKMEAPCTGSDKLRQFIYRSFETMKNVLTEKVALSENAGSAETN